MRDSSNSNSNDMNTLNNKSGFTIVELLIVIVVIAVLAAISVVVFTNVQERARRSQAISELTQLEKAILLAREQSGKTLMQLTGSNCTYCIGTQQRYDSTLDTISGASGVDLTGLKKGNPWGDRYRIDENEGEGSANPPCGNQRDVIGVNDATARNIPWTYLPYYQPQCS